jgi:hypothetical protein
MTKLELQQRLTVALNENVALSNKVVELRAQLEAERAGHKTAAPSSFKSALAELKDLAARGIKAKLVAGRVVVS